MWGSMATKSLSVLFTNLLILCTVSSYVYHEKSYVMFAQDPGDYFGYSIVLSPDRLYVGAPKALNNRDRHVPGSPTNKRTGTAYECPLKNLDKKRIDCYSLLQNQLKRVADEVPAGSWLGASMVLHPLALMITAPRENPTYHYKLSDMLQGACHFVTDKPYKYAKVHPLADGGRSDHQTFKLDGKRKDYGPEGTLLHYYSLGLVGFSAAITKSKSLILGAPGLMAFTGGILAYTMQATNSSQKLYREPIANPYLTMDLTTNEYLGYSVESGVFERNGSILYVGGAPRSELGRGKVLIFAPPPAEEIPLDIKAKLMGPQIGSYFGASLCSVDINNDGLDDLLVGAPTFVKSDGDLPYDQGAVFIYIAKESPTGVMLQESGYVFGSGIDKARFGNAIAEMGDIDGDGYRDVAIGAPWEDDGVGAVYIYLGNVQGLQSKYIQRIQPSDARGFGWSIAKGVDVDKNDCNDLAVGAFISSSAYLYRCVPEMILKASIKARSIINLPRNTSTFTAMFCVSAPPIKFNTDVKLNFTRKIIVDPGYNRAMVLNDSKHANVTATPNKEICYEKTIHVNVTADLTMPINLTFELQVVELMTEDSKLFVKDAARLSSKSVLKSSLLLQLMTDCGEDLLCKPWLGMTLKALNDIYTPGMNQRLGINITIWNQEEPSYGLKVVMCLPMHPKRIPSQCSLNEQIMTCDLPQPFFKNQNVSWETELEYNCNATESKRFMITAELHDTFGRKNITKEYKKQTIIEIYPEANFSVTGQPMPNGSITIAEDSLAVGVSINYKHYFEISNHGPSDWSALPITIRIPDKASYIAPIGSGCRTAGLDYKCVLSIPVNTTLAIYLPLLTNLTQEEFKGNNTIKVVSTLYLMVSRKRYLSTFSSYDVSTTFILEPAIYNNYLIWYLVAACTLFGLLILAVITIILHKCGFFSRKYRLLQEQSQLSCNTSRTLELDASVSVKYIGGQKIEESDEVDVSLSKKTASYYKRPSQSKHETTY